MAALGTHERSRGMEAVLLDIARRLPCPTHGAQDLAGKLLVAESVEAVPFTCCRKHHGLLKNEVRKALARRNAFRVVSNEG